MAVVRSPHAHARILGIDTRAAAGVPGVVTVLTAADLDGIGALPVLAHPPGQRQSDFPVLPADRALYAGQPVAAVVAESRYVAEDALEAVCVEWDPLPALTDVVRATAPGAPRLYEAWPDNVAVGREIGSGIPDGLFEAAHTVVEATFCTPRQTAAPLEGRGICAAWDAEAGALTVWASSQAPHQFRTVLAGVLGLDEERIRVIVPDVGGGFGVKLHYYPEDVLACVAAMRLGRPVRWIEDRREHFVATVHAREQTVRARAAFDTGGALLALDVHVRGDVGAHLHTKGGGPDLPRRRGAARPVRRAPLPRPPGGRRDEQGALRRLPRFRHAAGGVRDRAAHGRGGRAARDRSRRDPPPELSAAGRVPIPQRGGDGLRQR